MKDAQHERKSSSREERNGRPQLLNALSGPDAASPLLESLCLSAGLRAGLFAAVIRADADAAVATDAARADRAAASAASRTRLIVIAIYVAAALLLLPWSVLLATRLPQRHLAAHWNIAWAGFDIALAGTLLAVAVTAWRRSLWLEGAATAAAALLGCDAWFDLLTAGTLRELIVAAAEAVFVELPLALLCLWVARRTNAHWLRAVLVPRAEALGARCAAMILDRLRAPGSPVVRR